MGDADGEEELADFVFFLRQALRKQSLAEAAARLTRTSRQPQLVERAAALIRADAENFGRLRDPPMIEQPGAERWYPGPSDGDQYWPLVKTYIASRWNNPAAVTELDQASTRIVAAFGNPHSPSFSIRGLVAGDVQSGKTSNFTAVIAKAADAGYGLFIVLSGTKNKLRKQTQQRLDSDLVERDTTGWMWLTTDDDDFSQTGHANAAQVLARCSTQPVLMVVKKNKFRLERLAKWLEASPSIQRAAIAAVVVDDEADEASINSAKAKNKRAAVNGAILRILRSLPKVTFVGYTATPYANFLIDAADAEDLYPRHFIATLKTSPDYFGYEKIFGRERTRFDESDEDIDGYDMIRIVSVREAERLGEIASKRSEFVIEEIRSLSDALAWFVLATAARYARGQRGEHSSMLIHTSQRIAVHRLFRAPVEQWCESMRASVVANAKEARDRLSSMWEEEQRAVPPSEFELTPLGFDSVWAYIPDVLKKVKVVVENSMSPEEERLVYGKDPGIFITIGGDVLSRGLTLEGLVCSFFTRSASAYDTLMQMGRWFGYRPGYEDLPRIWMSAELISYFFELGSIDREMRQLIEKSYAGTITPLDYAPMIRQHPRLAITSRMKMQGPIVQREYSYGNRRVQTILFNHKNKTWLQKNLAATQKLIQHAESLGSRKGGLESDHIVFTGVPANAVLSFLDEYNIHENSVDMNREALTEYIKAERDSGSLANWSIAVVQGRKGSADTTQFSKDVVPRNVIRSRIKGDLVYANIKSLMSLEDARADLPGPPLGDIEQIIRARNERAPGVGLLVLYAIDANSPPQKKGTRVALDALAPVVGVGMVFPASKSGRDRATYVQLRLPEVKVEEPDDEDQEEEEGA